MIMLPRPHPGVLLRLRQLSVDLLRVDERHISVVRLRLLVEHLKDAVRPGKRHDNGIELLAHLVDRHVKTLVETQKTRKTAQCEPADVSKRQYAAHDGAHDITQVSKLCIDRSEHVAEPIRIVCALKQFLIQRIEALHALLLVAEHFDNFLPLHHLLDESVHCADGFLL